MSDIRQCSREFLTEFIEIYKSFPCLWKIKSREYNDRNKKNKAYEVLVEKYKEVDIAATRDTVTKKINSLRSSYRKEVAKVLRSEQNGENYRPILWYYNLLDFLNDQDLPRESKKILDDNSSCNENHWEYSEAIMDRLDEDSTIMGQSSDYEYARSLNTSSDICKGIKRSPIDDVSSNRKILHTAVQGLRPEDEMDCQHHVFGRYVAEEIHYMPPEMVPHVKKIINLAIFEGNMRSLNRSSTITTQQCSNIPQLTSSKKRKYPDDEQQCLPVQENSAIIQEQSPTTQELSPAIQQQSPAIQRQSPAIQQQSPAIQRQSPAIQQQSPAVQQQSPANGINEIKDF